mgnify:CR=1 FL=1
MESLRKNLFAYTLDDAPEDVRELYKDEFIQLYASSIKCFFKYASNWDLYREGVVLLQDLIKYGGRSEADKVTIERKARIPRHPVYIAVFCVL